MAWFALTKSINYFEMASSSLNRKLDDIITCCLCFEQYNTAVNTPKGLPCQHTFCAPCLNNHIRAANENGQKPKCPKCKAGFHVPRGGARDMPTIFSVQDIIDLNLHQEMPPHDSVEISARKLEQSSCKSHINRHIIAVCVECELGLCIDCMKSLNKSAHNKHTLDDIETYLSNYQDAIKALKARSNELPERYDQSQKAASQFIADTKQQQEREIDQQTENAIQEVKKWQRKQKALVSIWSNSSTISSIPSDIEWITSNVESLCRSTSEKLPSIKETETVMYHLERLEAKYQEFGESSHPVPRIESIKVAIKKQDK